MTAAERYFAQLQDERKRYEAICEFLTPAEREHVEGLRQARLRGEHAHYGHDLIGAIARGHRRRASELADALHEQCRLAATYGRPPATDQYADRKNASVARVSFAGAVRASIKAAARAGVAPEEVRTWLRRLLDAEDATSIEHMMRPVDQGACVDAPPEPTRGNEWDQATVDAVVALLRSGPRDKDRSDALGFAAHWLELNREHMMRPE